MANQAHWNLSILGADPTENLQTDDVYLNDGTLTPNSKPGFRRRTGAGVWEDVGGTAAANSSKIAILRDEKATTVDGGSSSATTWNARDLNTEAYDPDNIVAISSNEFVPIAGDYILTAHAAVFQAALHRLRLFNVTGVAVVEEGIGSRSTNATVMSTMVHLVVAFTADGIDSYRIDHWTGGAIASTGLGIAVDDGSAEVYLEIFLERVG